MERGSQQDHHPVSKWLSLLKIFEWYDKNAHSNTLAHGRQIHQKQIGVDDENQNADPDINAVQIFDNQLCYHVQKKSGNNRNQQIIARNGFVQKCKCNLIFKRIIPTRLDRQIASLIRIIIVSVLITQNRKNGQCQNTELKEWLLRISGFEKCKYDRQCQYQMNQTLKIQLMLILKL